MSSTRRAVNNSPFRQERFASSQEYERGLMGNLVAKRCELLAHAEDRDLIWWLQLVSWQPGGLAKLMEDLRQAYLHRIASKSMRKYGFKPGQVYDAEKVKVVRAELEADLSFPLKGQIEKFVEIGDLEYDANYRKEYAEEKRKVDRYPDRYPAADFIKHCEQIYGQETEKLLREICLNPEIELSEITPRYFPDLIARLREYHSAGVETERAGQVTTTLGKMIWETLDYALQGRCMVLIDGMARTGKSFAARTWCDLHPGLTRYVQVPSSNDDIGFFRAIARALGVSINQNSKAQELRSRIEDVLQRGGLMVVFDEAHYLWPQGNFREKMPARISWIMTALVNYGVPVGMVTTPQFLRTQNVFEKSSAWTSEQFTGRIGLYQKIAGFALS